MQRLEPRSDGKCNTITTVLKDNLVLRKVERMEEVLEEQQEEKTIEDYLYTAKDGEKYGIFKLSPRECGRLMGCNDADISKMLAVNSNSQCYKQYGNSIVVPVLMGIFSQLNIKGVPAWNDMREAERVALIDRTTRDWVQNNG
jgi:DNA (cytosine-5)-methyltransferase 1